ncbi:ARM repeat-containing protein [Coniochaeta sp. PMI_546]|nr:ARM repeat-containing protein [Coniochaeta sp. PMI_546]
MTEGMADKINDKQVADLITLLRTDANIEAKVNAVTAIKSGIKQHNVPDTCVAPLFDALRSASSSQHAVLVNAGFTALNHLLTRLSRQEPKYLIKEAARTLPLLVEKLGDQKEKFRILASQSMTTLYKVAPVDVERSVRNTAMVGKNARAKEMSLQWVLQMHQENGLQFRSYVPTLMELLEDADPSVRETAKTTVIELFRNAPNGAKSDLKRQLKTYKVRPAIEQAIVRELVPSSSTQSSQHEEEVHSQPTRPILAASMSSISSERPITPMPDSKPEQVEPMYVNTQRELDDIFREIHSFFEGKETEQNWLKREESMTKLRKLLAGNAVSDFHDSLLASLRSLLDGILKAVNSLRTSLSKEGCNLVQDMARIYGPGIDPMVEILMQNFIKLCGSTKKIASQQGNVTIDAIVSKVTFNSRILQHIWAACQDKNVQPRTYATGWLQTVLKKEAHHKSHIEHAGGLDVVEKCIKKGLADPNPGVREKMRATYWTFSGIWPARAEMILDSLDPTAQKLLRNDPHNPNSPKKAEGAPRPGLGLSKSTMGPPKPSLRETMLAQKKAAMAGKNLPPRPGSAMAHFSPQRTVSNSSTVSAAPASSGSAVRPRPEATHAVASSGLSVAPMRPRKRPELAARPATAGPYSVRGHDLASTEQDSPPERIRPKPAVTPKAMGASPKRTVQRPKPGHASTASESSLPTPSKLVASKSAPSPRVTPARTTKAAAPPALSSSPTKANEDFTMVVPTIASLRISSPSQSPKPSPKLATPPKPAMPVDGPSSPDTPSAPPLKVYEDPFTEDQATPKPSTFATNVLEDKPVNEHAGSLARTASDPGSDSAPPAEPFSPEKVKQNSRLLDSGIAKIKAKALDVHGFRKLQGIIRDGAGTNGKSAVFTDDRFDALVGGLFEYLESPLTTLAPEKVQDVKAQILATIRLMLKKMRDSFQPHVSRGLESLLRCRATYDGRTHMVSGLETLASDLVLLGDASEITHVLARMLSDLDDSAVGAARSLSMGLHVLAQMVDGKRPVFVSSESELSTLAGLAARCLESRESGVRMDAVGLCVALHARVGEQRFWEAVRGVGEDGKSLITYYVVKRQREAGAA